MSLMDKDSDIIELQISFFIMLAVSLILLTLESLHFLIFQREFSALMIYLPTALLGLAWLRLRLKR